MKQVMSVRGVVITDDVNNNQESNELHYQVYLDLSCCRNVSSLLLRNIIFH